MAIHPDFPKSPYSILNPDVRWFPVDEVLRESSYDKLLPPLVDVLRKKVKEWRDSGRVLLLLFKLSYPKIAHCVRFPGT